MPICDLSKYQFALGMYSLSRILICLDLSELDDQLIKAASAYGKYLEARSFYFLHVVQSLELPKSITKKYPDLIAPVDENVRSLINEKLDKYFKKGDDYHVEIDVVEGSKTDSILKWSRIKEVDMIIMGKKIKGKGSGIVSERVVRLCHCSFLLVPFNSFHGIKKIFVPIDFTDNSKMALEQAMHISEITGASITCQHTYKVPQGYHSSGKSYEEFAGIMKKNGMKEHNHFMKSMGLAENQFECIHTLIEHEPAKAIHDAALEENMDMIIMGSKGRTGLASILLRSVAIKTVRYDLEVELMVVKNKNENMGFLEAIHKL